MIPSYFHVNNNLGRCEPTIWQTAYHVGTQDDYKRCMCRYFPTDPSNVGADCPVETGSGENDDISEDDNTGEDDNTQESDDDTPIDPIDPIDMDDPEDAFAQIWERRNFNDQKPSRSMYQVDQSLNLIQKKLIEMYTVLHENQIVQ